jgi:hypothetical protein
MKKVLIAAAVAVLMSAPAFAAPQSYTLDVNTWQGMHPSQAEGQRTKWNANQQQGGSEAMQQQQQPLSNSDAAMGTSKPKTAKAMKTSGKPMKKSTTAKKKAKPAPTQMEEGASMQEQPSSAPSSGSMMQEQVPGAASGSNQEDNSMRQPQ